MLVREQMHFCCEEGGSGLQLTKSGVSGGGAARQTRQKTDRDKIRAGGEWRYETRKVLRGRGPACPLPRDNE